MREESDQQATDDGIITITDKELAEELKRLNKIDKEQLNRPGTKQITEMNWNGSFLKISGYAFINDTNVTHEDQVSKSLILQNTNEESCVYEFPVIDLEINSLMSPEQQKKHKWAGFEVEINFSQVTLKAEPLPEGTYETYIQVCVKDDNSIYQEALLPLGNIEDLIQNGFHSTKMEYFSSKRFLLHNLMATYNRKKKTLEIVSTKLKDINPAELEYQNVKSKQYKFMRKYVFKLLYMIFNFLPIKKNRVLFATDSRTELNGNFGFIHDEMISRNLDIDYKYMLKESIDEKKTFKDIWNLALWSATSKKIILDDFYPMIYPLRIRKEADLIQVWHAVGAFKTFGYSRVGRPGGPSIKSKNHRNYTKAIVSSKNVGRHYAEGFGIKEEETIVPIGAPRTDVFFDDTYKNAKKEELYDEYPFLKGKKVILFAPTFRGNGQSSAHYPFDVLNFKELYDNLKDEYVFIFKIHPFVNNKVTIPYQYVDFFYDFSEYREVNDLLFITDILITDYSSVCFEFALLNKPMIFFAYDVEDYIRQRDFYFEYQSFIPGTLAKNTEDIISSIINKDFEKQKIKPFVDYFFDHQDGFASRRFVDQVILENNPEQI
ncbi:CDP-ribitol ribitolphosphotransferase [Alkalihalobacillus xiaoxiensis]|uniref:CDP-ribitol ribitolphosphotransferase n=1 Tax=Shouchella xiaoxiensis TaxID=766895 RepID=A0ABS2T059_9BACI|nr:CDP-glycerol glycerophosphotransferase family protein [Shouchella xiaoxiensis]MBM7841176.1 CDP-ribitol ribitolphosphotransferase [Shouchella xiaoxiensis]